MFPHECVVKHSGRQLGSNVVATIFCIVVIVWLETNSLLYRISQYTRWISICQVVFFQCNHLNIYLARIFSLCIERPRGERASVRVFMYVCVWSCPLKVKQTGRIKNTQLELIESIPIRHHISSVVRTSTSATASSLDAVQRSAHLKWCKLFYLMKK